MTPGQGFLCWGVAICHIVKMHYFFKNLLLYSQALIRQTKYVVIISKEGSTKIVNFMTPGAGVLALGCGHVSHIVKMHYVLKNLLLYSEARNIVMIAKEGSTKIVNIIKVIIVYMYYLFSINIHVLHCVNGL